MRCPSMIVLIHCILLIVIGATKVIARGTHGRSTNRVVRGSNVKSDENLYRVSKPHRNATDDNLRIFTHRPVDVPDLQKFKIYESNDNMKRSLDSGGHRRYKDQTVKIERRIPNEKRIWKRFTPDERSPPVGISGQIDVTGRWKRQAENQPINLWRKDEKLIHRSLYGPNNRSNRWVRVSGILHNPLHRTKREGPTIREGHRSELDTGKLEAVSTKVKRDVANDEYEFVGKLKNMRKAPNSKRRFTQRSNKSPHCTVEAEGVSKLRNKRSLGWPGKRKSSSIRQKGTKVRVPYPGASWKIRKAELGDNPTIFNGCRKNPNSVNRKRHNQQISSNSSEMIIPKKQDGNDLIQRVHRSPENSTDNNIRVDKKIDAQHQS